MYSFHLALRYMARRITAYLAMVSFAIGVAVLIIVTSVMSGFAKDMKKKIRGTGSHMKVQKGVGQFICEYPALMSKIKKLDHVEAVSPRITWPVLYTRQGFGRQDPLQFALLTGIDPEAEMKTTNIQDYVEGNKVKFSYRDGHPEHPGLLRGLVSYQHEPRYGSKPLRTRNAIRYKVSSSKLTGQEKSLQMIFEQVGTYSSGMYDFDKRRIYCSLSAAQSFVQQEGCVTEIALKIDQFSNDQVLTRVKENIDSILKEHRKRGYHAYRIRSWKEQRSGLLQAVKAERGLTTILLFLVVVVAGFMLLAVLSMMVLEKKRDIGIIRSLGGTVRGVAGIFLIEGLIIGTIGSLIGFGLGYLVVTNINAIADTIHTVTCWLPYIPCWRPFPKDIYILDKIPYVWNTGTAFMIGAVTVSMSFFFSLIPAVRAARLVPIEAIRYE